MSHPPQDDDRRRDLGVGRCWHMFLGALALAVVGVFAVPVASADQLLRTGDAAWVSAVRAKEPVSRLSDHAHADARITFWTRIDGSSAALKKMRTEGRLPIRHRWSYLVGRRAGVDSATVENEEPLEVGRSEVFDGLDLEVSERGFFDWRTWSTKTIWPGIWTVEVVDNQGDPLPCEPGLVVDQDGCLFLIVLEK